MWQRETFDVIRHPETGVKWLCVKYETTYYGEPKKCTHYWPIRAIVNDDELLEGFGFFAGIIGAQAHKRGTGSYAWRRGEYDWIDLPLTDGGQTMPIRTVEEAISAPKTKAQTRWYCGQWQKYLKTKGWEPCAIV